MPFEIKQLDPRMMAHGNNLVQKAKVAADSKDKSQISEVEKLAEKYNAYLSALDFSLIESGDLGDAVGQLEEYLSHAKGIERESKLYNWRSNFAGSVIPEFIYVVSHARLAAEGYMPLFKNKRAVIDFAVSSTNDGPKLHVRHKDQDLRVGLHTLNIQGVGDVLVPILDAEVKTNIDKNKLNGLEFSAERLKRTFPDAFYVLITETIDFSLEDNYAGGPIDEVYVLRKRKRSEVRKDPSRFPLCNEVFEAFLTDVVKIAKRSKRSSKHIYSRLDLGVLIRDSLE